MPSVSKLNPQTLQIHPRQKYKYTCASCKCDRVEILDDFPYGIEDGGHAIFILHSHFCSFFISVAPSIATGGFGAPPAASDAQTIGAAAAGAACRPSVDTELQAHPRNATTNMGWGAPLFHGELLKLGISISQARVSCANY